MKLEQVRERVFLVNLLEIVGSLIVFNPIISVLIYIPLGLDSTEEGNSCGLQKIIKRTKASETIREIGLGLLEATSSGYIPYVINII